MKKTSIVLAALFISLVVASCQKTKEPEEKKEAQQDVQLQKEEVKRPPLEIKPVEIKPSETKEEVQSQQSSEAKPETTPKQQEQPVIRPEIEEQKPIEKKPSPLTDEEQKFLWKIDTGPWSTPNAFKTKREAIKYLRILLKGDHANIIPFDHKSENYSEFGDSGQRDVHAVLICTAIHALVIQEAKPEEAIDTVIEVLQKKADYPKAYACAAKYIGMYASREGRNERVDKIIPILKEAVKHTNPNVRLEAAGALLASGEADIAL